MRDSVASIELAVGGAVAILGARTFSLFQAAAAVPKVHAELVRGLEGDGGELERSVRRLGFRSPYAAVAGSIIHAAQDSKVEGRREALQHACEHAHAQVRRKFQRDQSLDLVAIALSIGVGAFAHNGLSNTPWFWPLAAALVLVLVLGLVARYLLRTRTDASLEQLAQSIAARQNVPARATLRTIRCPTCGHSLEHGAVTLRLPRGDEPATALLCARCGYVQATHVGGAPAAF